MSNATSVPYPLTMDLITFGQTLSDLGIEADKLPLQKRGPILRKIGQLWEREFPSLNMHQQWYSAADHADTFSV